MLSNVIDRISKICRNFLWAGGRAKVAWHDVCKPKTEGGLGLRDCKLWNSAMLMKTLWNIYANKGTLWIKWIHEVYLRGRNFWEWKCGDDDSPLVKNLEKL